MSSKWRHFCGGKSKFLGYVGEVNYIYLDHWCHGKKQGYKQKNPQPSVADTIPIPCTPGVHIPSQSNVKKLRFFWQKRQNSVEESRFFACFFSNDFGACFWCDIKWSKWSWFERWQRWQVRGHVFEVSSWWLFTRNNSSTKISSIIQHIWESLIFNKQKKLMTRPVNYRPHIYNIKSKQPGGKCMFVFHKE